MILLRWKTGWLLLVKRLLLPLLQLRVMKMSKMSLLAIYHWTSSIICWICWLIAQRRSGSWTIQPLMRLKITVVHWMR